MSRGEIDRLIAATSNLKHRVLLMTAYATGLRVSELVHLKPQDIHSERMLIRVDQDKKETKISTWEGTITRK
ncbi:MAG: tyrosine-type recombinase/integrase [Thermodesulfobacteriota bacterium]